MDAYISVKNFGPIEEAEIDLRPLTVFVGQSNTGKTYLAALIYALHQHFGDISTYPWENYHTKFEIGYLLNRLLIAQQESLEEEIQKATQKLNTPGHPFIYSDLPEKIRTVLESKLTDQENYQNEIIRCFDIESVSKLIRFTGTTQNEMSISLAVRDGNQTRWTFDARDNGSDPIMSGQINPDVVLPNTRVEKLDLHDLLKVVLGRKQKSNNSYYLPAARSGIMQSRDVLASALIRRATRIGLDPLEVSTFSGMIGDFLDQIVNYRRRRGSSTEIPSIAKQLETELLEGKIVVERSKPEAYPEFLYLPDQAKKPLRMSHSSAMVSELAPLVLYMRDIIDQGDLLIIEEPESHLHPEAQTIIAHTLSRLVRAGVRIIITTHSNWLLKQISNLIREGELRKQGEPTSESEDYLDKEEVGAWWFHKDKPVTELPFDIIEGIEPEEFLDIEESLYNRSAGLQNRIEQTKGKRYG